MSMETPSWGGMNRIGVFARATKPLTSIPLSANLAMKAGILRAPPGSGEWEEFVAEPHFIYGRGIDRDGLIAALQARFREERPA